MVDKTSCLSVCYLHQLRLFTEYKIVALKGLSINFFEQVILKICVTAHHCKDYFRAWIPSDGQKIIYIIKVLKTKIIGIGRCFKNYYALTWYLISLYHPVFLILYT